VGQPGGLELGRKVRRANQKKCHVAGPSRNLPNSDARFLFVCNGIVEHVGDDGFERV
jgi:hypothetical protein